ncbi:chemotaxis protein MotB [Tumebacillus sp. BK434]|uniref:flagellar motor protein MotB n=1 Tax=Tumebacillus sp. BK434 TaxID=2512169 RepID=UPI00104F09E5|nr:flagellar motor protein MotB [Tumebacillus sp. BK434]TCP55900.1 chemotaxis protein MotB [Tumebacillus sp. BK434]
MSRRKKKHGGHENHERWLITYADLITLLMIFFVIMYAMSSIDQAKFDSLSVSMNKALNPNNKVQIDSMGNTGIISKTTKEGQTNNKDKQEQQGGTSAEQEEKRLDELKKQVEKFIHDNNLAGQINVIDTAKGVQITLNDAALFESGSATLKVEAQRILGGMVPFLKIVPNEIAVEGHTDNVPINNARFPSNWELSAARAINVLHDIEAKGVPEKRLHAVGYADTKPLSPNDTVQNRASNRRVNLIVLREHKAASISPIDKGNVIQP